MNRLSPSATQVALLANAAENDRKAWRGDAQSVAAMARRGWVASPEDFSRARFFTITAAGLALPDVVAELARRHEARRPAREAAAEYNREAEREAEAEAAFLAALPPPPPPPPIMLASGSILRASLAEHFLGKLGDSTSFEEGALDDARALVIALYDAAVRLWVPGHLERKGYLTAAAALRAVPPMVALDEIARTAEWLRSVDLPFDVETDGGLYHTRTIVGRLKSLSFGASPHLKCGPLGTIGDLMTVVGILAETATNTGHEREARWALMALSLPA